VTVGGASAAFHAVSPVELDVTIPGTLPPGDAALDASDGTTTATLLGGVDIQGLPTITGPDSPCGSPAGGDTIIVHGTEFESTKSVTVGGRPATFEHSWNEDFDTTLYVTSPQHLQPGTVDVRVTNMAGTSAIVPADRFTYDPACNPQLPHQTG
jgi:hypothetical protein